MFIFVALLFSVLFKMGSKAIVLVSLFWKKENMRREYAQRICAENMRREYAQRICAENMRREYAQGIRAGNTRREYAQGIRAGNTRREYAQGMCAGNTDICFLFLSFSYVLRVFGPSNH